MSAHPPIHPLHPSASAEDLKLTGPKAAIYELLRELHQLEQMSMPRLERVSLGLKNDADEFWVASALRIVSEGWLSGDPTTWESLLLKHPNDPEILEGLEDTIVCPWVLEEITAVPAPNTGDPSCADLIRVMVERGIARPSTYAGTVEVLLRKGGYAQGDAREPICLTKQGQAVAQILEGLNIPVADPQFTAGFETQLDAVAAGQRSASRLLAEVLAPFYNGHPSVGQFPEALGWLDEVTVPSLPAVASSAEGKRLGALTSEGHASATTGRSEAMRPSLGHR